MKKCYFGGWNETLTALCVLTEACGCARCTCHSHQSQCELETKAKLQPFGDPWASLLVSFSGFCDNGVCICSDEQILSLEYVFVSECTPGDDGQAHSSARLCLSSTTCTVMVRILSFYHCPRIWISGISQVGLPDFCLDYPTAS